MKPAHKKERHICQGELCEICHKSKTPPASRSEIEILRQKIFDLVNRKPEKAAIILTGWLNGTSKTKTNKKVA